MDGRDAWFPARRGRSRPRFDMIGTGVTPHVPCIAKIVISKRFGVFALSLACLIGGALAPVRATQQTDPATQAKLERLRTSIFSGSGRTKEDIEELKAILAATPSSAEAHALLGIAYRTTGSPALTSEAIAELRQALELDPAFAAARLYLARIYIDIGRPARAKEELETALGQSPDNVQTLAFLGEAERQLKNLPRAIEVERKALAADPSFAQARYYLALALFDSGKRDEAIKELETVVRDGPKVVEPYLALGTAYLEANRIDDAVEIFSQGTHIDPARPDLRIQLARALRTKGQLDKAEAQLAIAKPAAGNQNSPFADQQQIEFDYSLELGIIRAIQGRLQAATESFQRALAVDPQHGPANRYLAEVYLRRGLYTRAQEYSEKAEKLGSPLGDDERKLLQEKLRAKKGGASS
jgi:tetratricopeptide (TPR) repeat protein